MKPTIKITQNNFIVLADLAKMIESKPNIFLGSQRKLYLITDTFEEIKSIPELNFKEYFNMEILFPEIKQKWICKGKFRMNQKSTNITHFKILAFPEFEKIPLDAKELKEISM